MHEGAMVKTGGCKMTHVNLKGEGEPPVVNPGDGANEFQGKCVKNEAVFLRKRDAGGAIGVKGGSNKPPNPFARINNFNTLGDHNMSGLGAPDAPPVADVAAFMQKSSSTANEKIKNKQSSNEELPMYANTTLNGKGFTMNPAPQMRYDSAASQDTFSKQYSEKPAEEGAEAAAEEAKEEETALGDAPPEVLKSDTRFVVVPMEIPEWMCSTICAGINLKDIMDGQDIQEPPEAPVKKEKVIDPENPHMSTEEGMILNTNRKG